MKNKMDIGVSTAAVSYAAVAVDVAGWVSQQEDTGYATTYAEDW
ncbi:MAG: hypothetical protein ACFHXK_02480 [bacterium]